MTDVATVILNRVKKVGGRLEPAGDKLRVLLPADCSPELKGAIRQHKSELLALLEDQAAGLRPDEVPWLHVARQVVTGEFDDCDRYTRESLVIGLRSIQHSICQQALTRLAATKS